MAQTKISQLTELSSIADNDVLAGVDTSAGTTKKVKMSTLKSYINTGDAQDVQINGTSVVTGNVANIAVEGTYNASTNKLETINDVNSKTGILSNLTTTDKTNLVSAINELNTNKEEKANKTTTINENSTDTQYPSAKATYDYTERKVQNVNDELEQTQAELEQYKTIFNALPKVTGSGENLSLDGTAESPLKMDLKGNTSQTQYTGKNLIDTSNNSGLTDNGITATIDSLTKAITLNGTATATALITFTLRNVITQGSIISISANNSSINSDVMVRLVTSSGSQLTPATCSVINAKSENYELTQDGEKVQIRVASGISLTNFTIKPQLELNSTATDYEPYVGGTPSPNPSYPQPIHVVSGDNMINVYNKNILDFNKLITTDFPGSSGSVVSSFNIDTTNLTITIGHRNSYESGYKRIMLNLNISCFTGKYFKISATRNLDQNYGLRGIYLDDTYSDLYSYGTAIYNNPDKPFKYLILQLYASRTDTDMIFSNMQIEMVDSSSSPATDYEPCKCKDYNVNLGSNIFDKDNATYNENHYINDNGVLKSETGTSYTTSYYQVKPNTTYTINGFLTDSGYQRIYYLDTNKDWISRTSSYGKKSFSFTTPSNCYYIQFQYTMSNFDATKIIIEEGISASYKPFGTTPIEMCKIGDYQDTFKKSDGSNLFDGIVELGTLNSTGENAASNDALRSKNYIRVQPNTQYTFNNDKKYYTYLYEYDENKTFISSTTETSATANPFTFTTSATTKYIRFRTHGTSVQNDLSVKVWLYEGSTAPYWQPYGVGKWYKYGAIGKVVLNGSEDGWTKSTSFAGAYYRSRDKFNALGAGNQFICTHLTYVNSNNLAIGKCANNNNYIFWFGDSTTYPDVTTFKAMLTTLYNNGTPVIVYVILATPTGQSISDSLAKQLDDIYVALSHKNQTNITQTNNDLPFTIDAQTLLDISNLENRVTLLED